MINEGTVINIVFVCLDEIANVELAQWDNVTQTMKEDLCHIDGVNCSKD
jgi:hypothetical protein